MLKIQRILAGSVSVLNSILKYICMILLFLMMSLGTIDVIGRYLFNNPILGTLEIFEIMLPAIVLLGLGYTQESNGHVNLDFFIIQLPSKLQNILNIFTHICALFISVLICWQGWILANVYWRMGRTIPSIDIPIFIPQLLVPLGALVLSLVLVVQIFEYIVFFKERN